MRLGCDTSTSVLGLAPTFAVARNSQTMSLTLIPKYAVQGRGATKPPAPESPRTANQCLFSILPLYHTVNKWG